MSFLINRMWPKIKFYILMLIATLPFPVVRLFEQRQILRPMKTARRFDYIKWRSRLFHKHITIFDLGANIGNFGKEISMRFPDTKLIGFEPNLLLKPYLESKKEYAEVYFKAVTDNGRDVEMYMDDTVAENIGSASSIYQSNNNAESPTKVKSIAVSELVENANKSDADLLILKIDIEGAELELFKSDAWSALKPKAFFIVEEHSFLFEGKALQHYKDTIASFKSFVKQHDHVYVQWV